MSRLPRIPYEEIDRRGDRSWTLRLIARVEDPAASKKDRWKAAVTLRELCDPRMAQPLRGLLRALVAPEPMREAAGEALRDLDAWTLPPDILRAWWAEGDLLLR